MSILLDLYHRYSPVISQAITMCVCLPSCPGHSRVRQGWRRRFRVTQASLVWVFAISRNSPDREISFPGTGNFFGTRENRVPLTSINYTKQQIEPSPSGKTEWPVLTSVILVQQFIFILVFIQFSVNHFYFYSVLVLSTFIHFSSYSVLVLDKPNL